MVFHTRRKTLTSYLIVFSDLVLLLLVIHFSKGQSHVIGSSQQVMAMLGDDIILPCQLNPAQNVIDLTVEWTRPDLDPRFVYVQRSNRELVDKKHQDFKGRTSLFIDKLKDGNISLKLSKVKLSDQGKYRCFIPDVKELFVELVVALAPVSSPIITLAGIETTSGVVLKCDSNGWLPEPEVLWLDAEGNLLSAGPTETVRGPDDLYTVSSRVTVEKRHSNRFTCRVQLKNINQTRDTQFYITDDFFQFPSILVATVVGSAVGFFVFILLIISVIFVWKSRKDRVKTKSKEEMKNSSESETDHLMAEKTVAKKTNHVRDKQAEVDQLSEEKQRMKEELQTLNEELENKNQELETIGDELSQYFKFSLNPRRSELQKKKEEVEQEVETLKKKVETKETEIQTKTEQFEEKQVELQQLQDKRQSTVTDLQSQEKELMFIKLEGGRTDIFRQLQQEKEEMMREVERLNIQQESMKAEFENKLQAEQEAVAKDVLLKKQLQKKIKELDKQLSAEKKERMESEKEMNKYITELEKQLSVGTQLMLETGSLKKQLEKRNSELQKRIRAEEQKKMEIEILKSQLEKNNTQLQAEKQRREKEAAALKEEKVMKSNPGPGEEMDLTTVQSVEENHNEEEIQQKPTSDTVTDDIPS